MRDGVRRTARSPGSADPGDLTEPDPVSLQGPLVGDQEGEAGGVRSCVDDDLASRGVEALGAADDGEYGVVGLGECEHPADADLAVRESGGG